MTTNPYESPENQNNLTVASGNWIGSTIRLVMLFGLLGMLLLMFVPRWPIGGAREAARRASCSNNLHNIALALQQYESAHGRLPPAYTVDADGKPLHSWRTLILPFLEQKALYKQIDLSKPWDDPANQQVRDTPLRFYECPSSRSDRGLTTYFAVVAPGSCISPTQGTFLGEIKDGRHRTLMLIEVSEKHAAHWMSPTDATEEMILNRKEDGNFSHPSGSQAAFVDGSVRYLTTNVRPEVLRAAISIAGNDDEIADDH